MSGWGGRPTGRSPTPTAPFARSWAWARSSRAGSGDIPRTYRVFDRAGRPFPVEQLPFSRVLATGQRVTVEGMVIHRDDGARIPIRAFGAAAARRRRDASPTSSWPSSTSPARRGSRRSATRIEARLKLAVDNAPIAVFAVDRAGIITLSEGAGLEAAGRALGRAGRQAGVRALPRPPHRPRLHPAGPGGRVVLRHRPDRRRRLRLLAASPCATRTATSPRCSASCTT